MKKKVILLIDDYEPTNILHEELISVHIKDVETHSFTNPMKALEAMKDPEDEEYFNPDIIFLDIYMPIMDAWEFLNAFNIMKVENKKSIAIYLLSTFDNEKYRERASKIELVNKYYTKPLTKVILQQAIYDSMTEG